MRALTFHGRETIRLESVPDPSIEAPTDAIVRVRLSSICGSDLHPYHEREKGLDRGTVMGHEFVGEVVEVGRDTAGLSFGDRVLSPFSTSCGRCFFCRAGLTSRCESSQLFGWVGGGSGLQGAQAEYIRVPQAEGTLLVIPDGVTEEEALLLGDVFSTGYFCARQAAVESGGTYAVVGCGPVGLMAIVGARELGAEEPFAIDSVPERLELARGLGARTIDREREDPLTVVREATEGRGADAVLEAVGSPGAGRLAMDLVRPGGTISVVGVHNEDRFPFTPEEAYDKNLTFRVGRCPARAVMEALIPVVQRQSHDIRSIISHRLPLDQGVRGYEVFDRKLEGCTKVVLDLTAEGS
jgi:threonine dehydrogenase-like Zn-dependent dehydrogenase